VGDHQVRHVPRQGLEHARARMCLRNMTSCIVHRNAHMARSGWRKYQVIASSGAAEPTKQSVGIWGIDLHLVVVLVGTLAPQGGMMPPELVSRDRGAVCGVPEWGLLRVYTGTSAHALMCSHSGDNVIMGEWQSCVAVRSTAARHGKLDRGLTFQSGTPTAHRQLTSHQAGATVRGSAGVLRCGVTAGVDACNRELRLKAL
jgi:hypothetical protein